MKKREIELTDKIISLKKEIRNLDSYIQKDLNEIKEDIFCDNKITSLLINKMLMGVDELIYNMSYFSPCKKGYPYEIKISHFNRLLFNVKIKNNEDLNKIYELIKNYNVIIAQLPLFEYNNKKIFFHKCMNKNYYEGKYKILDVKKIEKFLNKKYTIFIWTLNNPEHNQNEKLKFNTFLLKE